MLTAWHLEDIAYALRNRGWEGPQPLPTCVPGEYGDGDEYGHVHRYERDGRELRLFFWTDLPSTIDDNLFEVVATSSGREPKELWLHRTRNAKWKRDLIRWADTISG
jgi:hypothetical protein